MSSISAMRRPTSTSSSTTTSSSARSRHSMGGPGSEQTTPRSSLASRESLVSPPLSASSAQGTARASPLARGATARAAVPPPPSRGGSANGIKRGSPVPDRSESPAMSEALEGALRREVEEKEELMMRLASRDESIAELQGQIKEMRATMEQGGGRLAELYADQERWEAERASLEEDIAKKNNVIDKLRTQLRELEKENRDNTRRLTEQAAQFESERQAFYDNTAHLKSRIQSLTDAQKDWKQSQREPSPEPNAEQDQEQDQAQDPEQQQERKAKPRTSLARSEPEEPPEMTALRLELSTLGTSHGSLGQTVKMLQSQLAEIERTPAVDPRVAGLKPLNLRADAGKSSVPSSPIIHGGRKLDNEEDEEDRIERERLHAQMKLMGYEKEPTVHTPGAAVGTFAASMSRGSTTSSGADTPASREVDTPGSRMSVGWGRRPASVRQDSTGSGVRFPTDELRAEHLELEDDAQVVAAAETRIAALDRQEKALSAEMAKGRGGGFTEPPGRGTRVRRRSNGSGSGSATSTLFSAGRLSRGGSEADIGEDAEETV
ncbi:hypothetical protein FRC07_008844 [Ceratobasidium sp. 392]|nr:hypothetical protein FRC07_008844 [Ceratobasidium sp. 392]